MVRYRRCAVEQTGQVTRAGTAEFAAISRDIGLWPLKAAAVYAGNAHREEMQK